ncbi:hypothetical protein BB561_006001 [Smittium simulii]|uniref:Uncharacterized protein n=1 Tax=Smittium simulii TaxID=133385 RepID=A0A2T9Y729_9FUNG|nr:hypothetical protein BB561_006001 [Smittium simulii]
MISCLEQHYSTIKRYMNLQCAEAKNLTLKYSNIRLSFMHFKAMKTPIIAKIDAVPDDDSFDYKAEIIDLFGITFDIYSNYLEKHKNQIEANQQLNSLLVQSEIK